MLAPGRHIRLALASLMVAAAGGAIPLASAPATPSVVATSTLIEQKQAEEEAARQELEQMRIDLTIAVADYLELGKEIARTEVEIDEITAELAAMTQELDEAEAALERRAIELYRGDRFDMLRLILTSRTLTDLWVRSTYLAKIGTRDVRLISEVRLARSENLWLQQGLLSKVEKLDVLRNQADEQRSRIETDIAVQQERAERLKVDLARLMWTPMEGAAVSRDGFDPNTVIAEEVFRDSGSMTVEQIQAFLASQSGTLATYRAKDHAGKVKSTAEIIHDAARRWGVNPKVIMATLQKEQSLLSRPNPKQNAYDWAMGCGKTDSRTFTKYKGFGMQIWSGAEKLAKNGEGWRPGASMKIDGSLIHPTNKATYSLFRYTPHFPGTMSFWLIYWRYFGDPMG